MRLLSPVGAKDTSTSDAAAQKAAEMADKKAEANRQLEAELAEGSNKGMNSKKKKPEDPNAIKKVSKSDAKDKMEKARKAMEKAEKKISAFRTMSTGAGWQLE